MTRTRATVPCLLAVLLVALVALLGPSRPAAATARTLVQPNIVLILTDDQTVDALAKMPYVSAQRWVRFDHSYTENALCCPSRATILQGRWDTHTGVTNNAQAVDFDASETLPVWLGRVGYRTGLFGKYLNGYDGLEVPPGWDEWQVPFGDALYQQYGYPLSNRGTVELHGRKASDYQVDLLERRAATFVRRSAAAHQPFFLEFTPTATHSPWVASPTRTGASAADDVPHLPSFEEEDVSDKPAHVGQFVPQFTPEVLDQHHRQLWDASLSVDDAVRRLDAVLTATGTKKNTVVVLLSDNGYSFGEHRWENKRCEFEECSLTPLLVRYPGVPARRDGHLVSNVDLAQTISSLAGASPTLQQDGRDLLPLIAPGPQPSDPTWREAVLQHWPGGDQLGVLDVNQSLPAFWGVRTLTERYVELVTGEREYYDLATDPYELVNRVDDPEALPRVLALQAELIALKQQADADTAVDLDVVPPTGPIGFEPDLG